MNLHLRIGPSSRKAILLGPDFAAVVLAEKSSVTPTAVACCEETLPEDGPRRAPSIFIKRLYKCLHQSDSEQSFAYLCFSRLSERLLKLNSPTIFFRGWRPASRFPATNWNVSIFYILVVHFYTQITVYFNALCCGQIVLEW